MEPTHDGTDRNIQDFSYFLIRKTFDVGQHDGRAVLLGQFIERIGNGACRLYTYDAADELTREGPVGVPRLEELTQRDMTVKTPYKRVH